MKVYKKDYFVYNGSEMRHRYIVYRYRFDPVPGIHKRKKYSIFKRPKTTQERKYACSPEHKPYVRGKRRLRYLPEAWDDIFASSNYNKRSWKKVKKRKQWM